MKSKELYAYYMLDVVHDEEEGSRVKLQVTKEQNG